MGAPTSTSQIPKFTLQELQKQIRKMANGKSCDEAGICSEMLKCGGEVLDKAILELFNEIIRSDAQTPETWNSSKIAII